MGVADGTVGPGPYQIMRRILERWRGEEQEAAHRGAGYDADLARDIQQIRQNLIGYSDRAWLKEMVQNADDAGASRLELGWVASIDGVSFANPLLGRTPALFVLNDGRFTADHARAIHKLGA